MYLRIVTYSAFPSVDSAYSERALHTDYQHGMAQPQSHSEHKEAKPTIQAASTVVRIPRADQDKTVTSMVPASLRVRRDAAAAARSKKASFPSAPSAAPSLESEQGKLPAFNAAPSAAPVLSNAPGSQTRPTLATGGGGFDRKYEDFMHEMADLGALGA